MTRQHWSRVREEKIQRDDFIAIRPRSSSKGHFIALSFHIYPSSLSSSLDPREENFFLRFENLFCRLFFYKTKFAIWSCLQFDFAYLSKIEMSRFHSCERIVGLWMMRSRLLLHSCCSIWTRLDSHTCKLDRGKDSVHSMYVYKPDRNLFCQQRPYSVSPLAISKPVNLGTGLYFFSSLLPATSKLVLHTEKNYVRPCPGGWFGSTLLFGPLSRCVCVYVKIGAAVHAATVRGEHQTGVVALDTYER